MPLPPPIRLLLNEALEYVVERCYCSHDAARAELIRAFKERALTLYDDRDKQVDIIRGKLDWEKSSITISNNRWVGDYTAPIWLYRSHLRRWIGPATPHQAQSLPTTVRTRAAPVEAPTAPRPQRISPKQSQRRSRLPPSITLQIGLDWLRPSRIVNQQPSTRLQLAYRRRRKLDCSRVQKPGQAPRAGDLGRPRQSQA